MMASLLDRFRVHRNFLAASKRAFELGQAAVEEDRVLASTGRFKVVIARTSSRLDQAFELRYRVFADELGARLDRSDALDHDEYDAFCRHLVVIDTLSDEVVGTYRLLTPQSARRCGSRYIEREFDITPLASIQGDLVELGRACVDPDYRSGVVIMLLWSGIGQFMAHAPFRYLVGCASVPVQNGTHEAAALYRLFQRDGLFSEQWRIKPLRPLPIVDDLLSAELPGPRLPGLFKAYLKAGGKVIGAPSLDPTFHCIDFPVMLDLGHVNTRYQRRFVPS